MTTTQLAKTLVSLAAACLLLLACNATRPNAGSQQIRDCDLCPTLVEIPAGTFLMGFDGGEEGRPEGPVRAVAIIRPFALASTETTLAEFRAFVEASGYQPQQACRTLIEGRWQNSSEHDWLNPGKAIEYGENRPVVCVSWQDAVAYTGWLSEVSGLAYRLPSEAEWEYAARGGSDGIYFWGDDPAAGCEYANLYDRSAAPSMQFSWTEAPCNDGYPTLAPVGAFRANSFGLYDMLGNVWEWTADCYVAPYPAADDPQQPVDSRSGVCERRSVRGGGWITRPDRQRLTFRGRDPAQRQMSYFGFRVARSLDAAADNPAGP